MKILPETVLRSSAPPLLAALCLAFVPAASRSLEPGRAPGSPCPVPATAGVDGLFAPAMTCALCHSAADTALAMRSATGDDVSPHGLWKGTMMANAFRDPFWRAQIALERAQAPEWLGDPTPLCVRCHAPMAHHDSVAAGEPAPNFDEAKEHPLAEDGISCTLCHQITEEGLGEERTLDGRVVIGTERKIFGPYPDPSGAPMTAHTGYVPTHSEHVRRSEFCAGCHTLRTQHAPDSERFQEQTPWLEWRNSVFAREGEEARTCQECHMPDMGTKRIARNPRGFDFNIERRSPYRAHVFAGANAYMLDLMADHAEELGISEREDAMRRNAVATRALLADQAARLQVREARLEDGRLRFDLEVVNLTGHKLPTGYPARRAYLQVLVRQGRRALFRSGGVDGSGRLVGVEDEHAVPHRDVVRRPEDHVVYESVALDEEGRPTTVLTRMASRRKDNRLLPRGWRADGPDAELTAPVGTGGDTDFGPGRDLVHFDLDVGALEGRVIIVAWLRLQTVPPSWVDPFRGLEAEDARSFVSRYDGRPDTGEELAVTVEVVDL